MTKCHLLILNLLFRKASILSEYLQTSQNDMAIIAARIIQIRMPHQVLNGISPKEYAVANDDKSLVTTIITMKYPHVIDDNPATKHKTSSGNIGSRNIIESIR